MEEYWFHPNAHCVTVKKSWFVKEQEASGLSSSSRKKMPLSKISLVGSLLF